MKTVRIHFCGICRAYKGTAVRMAALIKERLGLEVKTIRGGLGEFTVWVDDRRIVRRRWWQWAPPRDQQVLEAVQQELNQSR